MFTLVSSSTLSLFILLLRYCQLLNSEHRFRIILLTCVVYSIEIDVVSNLSLVIVYSLLYHARIILLWHDLFYIVQLYYLNFVPNI